MTRAAGPAVALLLGRYNRASLTALAAALEVTPATAATPLVVARLGPGLATELAALVARHGRLIAACSFVTWGLVEVAALVRALRAALAEALDTGRLVLVAGGPHASALPAQTLALGFDYVVQGEGEEAFPALVAALACGDDPLAVLGVRALRAGALAGRGPAPAVELARFPAVAERASLFSYLESTRGCPEGCGFCQVACLFGRRLRHRSLEALTQAGAYLHRKGRRDIRLLAADGLSWGSQAGEPPRLDEVARLLEALGRAAPGRKLYLGTFPSDLRPTSVSADALRLLKRYVANDNLVIGLQSASARLRALLGRRHGLDCALAAIELALGHGFIVNVDFIVGVPGEQEDDLRQSLATMRQLARPGVRLHVHGFMPLPGTALGARPPQDVPPWVAAELVALAGTGRLFGNWREQIARARRIFDLLYPPPDRLLDGPDAQAVEGGR